MTVTGTAPTVGQTVQFTASQSTNGGPWQNVTPLAAWSSNFPAIASVNAAGQVTGVSAGMATISAMTNLTGAGEVITVMPVHVVIGLTPVQNPEVVN
jgi:uncharacterized protein YjdB